MSKRTSDSKVKAPLSALAARRLRQQQLAAKADVSDTPTDTDGASPAITPTGGGTPANGHVDRPRPRATSTAPSTKETSETAAVLSADARSDAIPRQVSSFTQTEDNYVYVPETGGTIVSLRQGESLVVQGEYRITVISGAVAICGAVLEASGSLDVIAPSSQALPVIECAPKSKKRRVGNRNGGSEFDVVFSMWSIHSGLGDVGRICPRFDRIWKPPRLTTTAVTKGSSTSSFAAILESLQPPATLAIPPSWQTTIANLCSPKRSRPQSIFIVGGKSAGKSTFSRCLTNAIATLQPTPRAVAYLDLDPGQPSFTPPCMLSLHKITSAIVAPSFAGACGAELVRQHHIGYASPREDPKYYLQCAADLMRACRTMAAERAEEGEEITLIINTCGWIKGMGRELLRELVQLCEPTDAVGLGDLEGVFTDILPEGFGSGNGTKRHLPEAAAAGGGQPFTPADLRMLQTVAYFHRTVHKPADGEVGKNTPGFSFEKHLTMVPPLLAAYRGPGRVIHGMTVLDVDVPPELLFAAVNATVVAVNLVQADNKGHPVLRYLEDEYDGKNESEYDHRNTKAAPYIRSDQFDGTSGLIPVEGTITAGLAIVRGTDEEKGVMQLLTPVGEDELNAWIEKGYLIVLCRGRDEMPVWLMWSWRGPEQREKRQHQKGMGGKQRMPYLDFVVGGEVTGKGAKEWKVRRNIMRRGQQRR
ncbi:hypothetical protein DRE_02335 [Drechslerella stenobrocha 248]|uniref:Polynucleotide 5'-hydroxyl-kinase GRC3 n=1 Tax=Drechslerella stenobrocha 248 TaxID=1043628 RepID=W7HVL9_9PEZI|nr:hypothetical protein DRE_02335 [Drechslerella stenobrocha 248]